MDVPDIKKKKSFSSETLHSHRQSLQKLDPS